MDPQWTSDGKLFATQRYKDLVKERYLITKYTHTSYNDTAYITPLERKYIFDLISEELKRQQEAYEKAKTTGGIRK